MPAQYTGHGANTGGLQAHSIGEGYPFIVVGIDNPAFEKTRWRVIDSRTGAAVTKDIAHCGYTHQLAAALSIGQDIHPVCNKEEL